MPFQSFTTAVMLTALGCPAEPFLKAFRRIYYSFQICKLIIPALFVMIGTTNIITKGTVTMNGEEPKAKEASSGGDGADTEYQADERRKPLIEMIYDAIVGAVGGDAQNQYFTMMMPGTVLNPQDYEYSGEKPAHVIINESKLANNLFDPAFVVNSDNGKKLYQQYKSSLNILSPKLNPVQSQMKTNLRALLLKKFPYDFGEGTVNTMTFSQVFYKLYEEYISVKSGWSAEKHKVRQDIKTEYYTKYGIDELRTDAVEKENIDRMIEEKYLKWYESVSQTRELEIEEKLGTVLSVFSPNDINAINGILESGSGEEIEQARILLRNAERLNSNGGKFYPVNMVPSNWAEYLGTSFSEFDLLEGISALKLKIYSLESEKARINNYIEQIALQISEKKKYEACFQTIENAKTQVNEILKMCYGAHITATSEFAKSLVNLMNERKEEESSVDASDVEQLAIEHTDVKIPKTNDGDSLKKLIKNIEKSAADCREAMVKSDAAILDMADLLMKENESEIGFDLKKYVLPLKEKLLCIEPEIAEQRKKLRLAVMQENNNEYSRENRQTAEELKVPADSRFTPITISALISDMYQSGSSSDDCFANQGGESFLFGGYNPNIKNETVTKILNKDSDDRIQIAMNIVKVGIEREWFNPGVFQLTKDMNRFSDTRISVGNPISFTESSKEEISNRFEEMKNTVFPAYPVSFIIAKDVTIRLIAKKSYSSAFSKSIENHVSRGGGFMIFSSNRFNNSSLNDANTVTHISDNMITIRFKAPQILGYYMQTVSEDKSTVMGKEQIGKDDSIKTFVNAYKKFIDELNKKNKVING